MEQVVFHYFDGNFEITPNLGLSTHMSGSSCNLRLAVSSVFVVFVAESVTLSSLRSLWLCYPHVGVICQNLNTDSWIVDDPCCDSALVSSTYPRDLPAEYILEENESFRKFTLAAPQMVCNKCGLAKQPERLIFAARQKVNYLQFEDTEEKLARPTEGLELEVLNAVFGKGSYVFRNEKYIVHCKGPFKADGCHGSMDPTFFRETHMTVGAVKVSSLIPGQISLTNYWLLDSMSALLRRTTQEFSAAEISERIETNVVGIFLAMALGLTLLLTIERAQSLSLPSYDPHSFFGRILYGSIVLTESVWILIKLIGVLFVTSLMLRSKCFDVCLLLWRVLCFLLSTCISAEVVSMLSYAARIDPPKSVMALGEFLEESPTRLSVSPGLIEQALNKDRWGIFSDPITELLLRDRGDPVTDPGHIARLVASGSHVAYYERRILESGIHHASDVSDLLVLSDFEIVDVIISWAMQKDCGLLKSTNRKLAQMKEMGVISWMYMKRNMRSVPASSAPAKAKMQDLSSVFMMLQSLGAVAGTIGLIFELFLNRLEKSGGLRSPKTPGRVTL